MRILRNFLDNLFWRTSAYACFWKCSWNWDKLKAVDKRFYHYIQNRIIQHQYQKKEVKMCISLFLFHDWFPLEFLFTYNISLMWWEISIKQQTSVLELIKRRSNIREKNVSWEDALNFDQWKTFSDENYKAMTVCLWLAYKFTENYCRLPLFSEFIQTQKRYPTFLDKIGILT